MQVLIRPLVATDRVAWGQLYRAYAAFYGVPQSDAMQDRVWGWLHDPAHEVNALVAEQAGQLVGLAHYRAFARPLSATTGGFLDDLFVSPDARGTGAAQALLEAVAEVGRAKGWSVIRWITAADNARARGLYDKIAAQTPWVTYDIKL